MFKKLLKRCRKRKEELKPGAILDQVISQSSSKANTCLLYKLANYKRGGDLIDAMQTGGQIAVEAMIREQFPMFMYNGGRGQIINRAEYLRWKYKDNKEVMIPIEASLSPHDPLGKWEDHKACWQMQYRGSLGESLLHVLIICDTKIHTKLARLLIRVFPMLALDIMEGEEYLGASALHLSIAYSNNELVIDLIEAGARVDQRATGSFFLPRDQQGRKPSKSTDYEGLAYLGEYPLAWAACCANESVYNLLLDNGADPDAQDTFGNMILHMVVVCDKLDMFGYALRHPKQPARNGIVNDAGLTPLTLACQLGRAEVFREMLELSAKEFWRYSNITCSGYPLNALDTLLPDGRTNWNSALFIILNGTKEEHLDMLDGGIIQRLLEEKWKTFARRQFLKRLLILVLHLLCLSISVYLRPSTQNHATIKRLHDQESANMNQAPTVDQEEDDFIEETDVNRIIRYCSEVATIIGVLSYVIFQQGDEVKNQGLVAFLKQLSHAPAKAIFLVSNLLILACIPFRIMGDTDTEEAILVFAVPGSWFLLMFFAGAIRLTGPFVTMIFSMITGDMFTFGIIYVIVLFGFSQAFYFLYKGHPQVQQTLFSNYFSTWMALFQTTLGDYNYSELNNTTYPNLSKTVFVIFMIFVPILLLNMLIAMMGNTYAHVIEQSEKEWMKQWAKIVVTLERAVSQSDAKSYLEAYSIPLGPANDDSGFEQRGVMVIKSKSKTRAKQRKGAVANWKRVGKVTLNALKNRGMTGEEMRRLMWGRTSISTPTKVPLKKHRDPNSPFASGALEAVLDGMAFTHDLVLCGDNAEVTVTKDAATPATTATVNPAIKGKLVSSPSLIKETLGQLPGTVGITAPQPAMTTTMGQTASIGGPNYKDPLRELVLISEAICISDDTQLHNDVHNLAKQATVLDHCKEVNANQKDKDKPLNLQVNENLVADPNKSNITTLFQDPKDIVDPEKEKEFLRRVEMLEDSDSDAFGEKPMLGKVSLIRRAKSAMTKSSTQRKNSEEQPLFKAIWDFLDKRENFNVGAENKAFEIEKTSSEADDDDNVSAAEEIRRQMETLHMKRGIAIRNEVKDNRNKKRLARNKVSPSEDSEDENAKETRRGKSAPAKKINSPPHPLQPWSTKDIMNINQILDN